MTKKEQLQDAAKDLPGYSASLTIADLESLIASSQTPDPEPEEEGDGPEAGEPEPEKETPDAGKPEIEEEEEEEEEIDWNLEPFRNPSMMVAVSDYCNGRGEDKLKKFLNSCLPVKD